MRKRMILVARGDPVGERLAVEPGAGAEVRVCSDRTELRRAASGWDVLAVVTGLRDADGRSARPALLALRVAAPTVPVLVACSLSEWETGEVVELAAAGYEAVWVMVPFEDLRGAIARLLLEDGHGRRRDKGPELAMVRGWRGALSANMSETPTHPEFSVRG